MRNSRSTVSQAEAAASECGACLGVGASVSVGGSMCGRVLCARLNPPVLCCATLCCMCERAKGGGGACSYAERVSAALVRGRAHRINPSGHQGAPQWTDELRTPRPRPPLNCPGQVTASLSPSLSPSLPLYLSLCCALFETLARFCFSMNACATTLRPQLFSHLLLPRFTTFQPKWVATF